MSRVHLDPTLLIGAMNVWGPFGPHFVYLRGNIVDCMVKGFKRGGLLFFLLSMSSYIKFTVVLVF